MTSHQQTLPTSTREHRMPRNNIMSVHHILPRRTSITIIAQHGQISRIQRTIPKTEPVLEHDPLQMGDIQRSKLRKSGSSTPSRYKAESSTGRKSKPFFSQTVPNDSHIIRAKKSSELFGGHRGDIPDRAKSHFQLAQPELVGDLSASVDRFGGASPVF